MRVDDAFEIDGSAVDMLAQDWENSGNSKTKLTRPEMHTDISYSDGLAGSIIVASLVLSSTTR